MKKSSLAFLFLLFPVALPAQSYADFMKQARKEYSEFNEKAKNEYKEFRARANYEYSEFMRQAWEEYEGFKPIEKKKEPVVPPVILPKEDRNRKQESKPVVIDKVIETPEPAPIPAPVVPIVEIPEIDDEELDIPDDKINGLEDDKVIIDKMKPVKKIEPKTVDVHFFGGIYPVRVDAAAAVHLNNTRESSVADMWASLSGDSYNNMLFDCNKYRTEKKMSDWTYLKFCESLAASVYPDGFADERIVLETFALTQSGFKATMGRDEKKALHLLVALSCNIYNYRGWDLSGSRYYLMDKSEVNRLNVFNGKFPGEKPLRLEIEDETLFEKDYSEYRTLVSDYYPEVKVSVRSNRNLVDFYGTYPVPCIENDGSSRWRFYTLPPLSNDVKDAMYPVISNYVKGLSEENAANVILNFVQTAFVYEYDDKVWGTDRTFFADETVFYPYCDCEDRSVLYSRMVTDILGLEVVLVYYPGHLATAVHFNENVDGCYFELEGKRYVVCDPTYINASVGMAMPQYVNSKAKILKLHTE